VIDGALRVGVLASVPAVPAAGSSTRWQDVSQFYNSFQGAASALEKLSGILDEEPSVAEPADPVALHNAPEAGRALAYSPRRRPSRAWRAVRVGAVRVPLGDGAAGLQPGQSRPGRQWRWSARPGRARRRSPGSWPGSTIRWTGGSRWTAWTCATCRTRYLRAGMVVLLTQETSCSRAPVADNIRLGRPAASDLEVRPGRPRRSGRTSSSRRCPLVYQTPVGKRGGRLSAGQRAAHLVSPARSSPRRACWYWTRRPRCSTIPSERLVQAALRTVLDLPHRGDHRAPAVDGGHRRPGCWCCGPGRSSRTARPRSCCAPAPGSTPTCTPAGPPPSCDARRSSGRRRWAAARRAHLAVIHRDGPVANTRATRSLRGWCHNLRLAGCRASAGPEGGTPGMPAIPRQYKASQERRTSTGGRGACRAARRAARHGTRGGHRVPRGLRLAAPRSHEWQPARHWTLTAR